MSFDPENTYNVRKIIQNITYDFSSCPNFINECRMKIDPRDRTEIPYSIDEAINDSIGFLKILRILAPYGKYTIINSVLKKIKRIKKEHPMEKISFMCNSVYRPSLPQKYKRYSDASPEQILIALRDKGYVKSRHDEYEWSLTRKGEKAIKEIEKYLNEVKTR